ncbi:MAG: sigma-70 family RNA polymerase sigma factor [Nitrospira sp.]|nr:sigma-70 family RNA polymerase sigma factor [Nitrospira sp.]
MGKKRDKKDKTVTQVFEDEEKDEKGEEQIGGGFPDIEGVAEETEETEETAIEPDVPEAEEDEDEEEKEKEYTPDLDVIRSYLHEISHASLLTFQDEKELADAILHGDSSARDTMIEANLRLVVNIGKRYLNRGLPLADIIEEGNLGLMKAVERYDHTKGFRFSTYASWWIKQSIERAIINQTKTIRLPVHVAEHINKYLSIVEILIQEYGREPSTQEIADKMKYSSEDVEGLKQLIRKTYSLETPVGDHEESYLKDIIADSTINSPAKIAEWISMRHEIDTWLDRLKPKERDVICKRFGLLGQEPMTLEEIGQEFGLTRERIRQIEATSLGKLRGIIKEKKIRKEEVL